MLEIIRMYFFKLADSNILPNYFKYSFVVNALISSILIGPLLGGLGTMVVIKKMAFFSEAIGHAALTGIALAVLLGESYESPYILLYTYCLMFAILINFTRNRTKMGQDTLIGIFLSISIALGGTLIILVSDKVNAHILESVLFGSILTVSDKDIYILLISTILILLVVLYKYNHMLLSSFNKSISQIKGVNTVLIEYLFIILITIVTVSSIKIIGAALVEALFLIPAASSKNISNSLKSFVYYSIFFALLSCIIGILLPLYLDLNIPSGGSIILVSSVIFILTVIIKSINIRIKKEN
ncbi:metal ABC transporter permease [Oceanivirga miroungae]|uniref:Manganese transport system membrane protein MntB n=1 Tax=Oceanivirga miroungae TaxID=1130046 RepID=A0A6I8MBG1_9FUSO|nr:metal ABC transporter permease [Oceanivirga miroungae]VWL85541.1 Manganese transport system membrane protein MntB [Oceanivirga miroungae]